MADDSYAPAKKVFSLCGGLIGLLVCAVYIWHFGSEFSWQIQSTMYVFSLCGGVVPAFATAWLAEKFSLRRGWKGALLTGLLGGAVTGASAFLALFAMVADVGVVWWFAAGGLVWQVVLPGFLAALLLSALLPAQEPPPH